MIMHREREMNTQLLVEPLTPRKNYSLIIMGISNDDGDGPGGTSPSRQGARTETFCLPNLPFGGGGAAELFVDF